MSQLDQRIKQWEMMATAAPDEMAYFSLANAYREAGRDEDAIVAYRKALDYDDKMSRAYQLLGQLLLKHDQPDEAKEVLTAGYRAASERGDVMPQRAIGSLLKEKLGVEPPSDVKDAESVKADVESTGEVVLDRRTGTPQPRLPDPPMRGPVGRFIFDHFGAETWRTWIGQGTKVINELRLDFSNDEHQAIYDQHMLEWLQVTPEEINQYNEKLEAGESEK